MNFARITPVGVAFLLTLASAERMSFLDNGSIRIGVDLDLGGSITHPPDESAIRG